MLRILHIRKDPASTKNRPLYSVVDAGRYSGENEGWAPAGGPMGRHEIGDLLETEGVPFSRIERALEEVDRTGSAQVQASPKVGPRITRAWFDTVCNPLIDSLELELGLIKRRNWTFAFRPATLELIRKLANYIEDRARPNLDQILQFDHELKARVAKHDNAVEALLYAATELHQVLIHDPDFARLCDQLFDQEEIEAVGYKHVREVFGAYPPADYLSLIAQYIVNNLGELPSHYSTEGFWNHHRDRLIAVLDFAAIKPRYDATVAAGELLANTSSPLLDQILRIREELSIRHDVPYFAGEPHSTLA